MHYQSKVYLATSIITAMNIVFIICGFLMYSYADDLFVGELPSTMGCSAILMIIVNF